MVSPGETLEAREESFTNWITGIHDEFPHGRGDLLGSLNYLDRAARVRGRDAIRDGVSVGLARTLGAGRNATLDGEAFSFEAFESTLGRTAFMMRTDRVSLDCHGGSNTHIDALNHLGWHGQWYNGTPLDRSEEAGDLVALVRHGIFTRAVHANVAEARGDAYIHAEYPVTADDIDRALAAADVQFAPGDALLLDCGRDRFEAEHGPWHEQEVKPGAGSGVSEWIREHRPSLLLWDMLDASGPYEVRAAVHRVHWALGLILVDNCSFQAARPVMEGRSQHSGGLSISPLPIPGATGNNVNPMVIL